MENTENSPGNLQKKQNNWKDFFESIGKEQFMIDLKNKVSEEYLSKSILPSESEMFNAFKLTPYDQIKIVILGQDPYPNKEDAHGLAFSSLGKTIPRSLNVIFNEIKRSIFPNYPKPMQDAMFMSADLTQWAKQGVLLLNTILTVEEGKSDSHKGIGWEEFTKKVLAYINESEKPIVFMFWGRKAQVYMDLINMEKHLVLTSFHPAAELYNPSENKFVGNGHFFKAIEFLHQTRSKEKKKMDLDLMQFIDVDKMVDYIFDKMESLRAPNELLFDDNNNAAITRDIAKKRLFSKKEIFEITNTIDWKTS